MQKISGKEVSKELIDKLRANSAPPKILGAVLVGDDLTSISFLKQKGKIAKELGIDFRIYELPADITNDNLREEIGRLARNKSLGGVILQLPLPEGLNKQYALNAIPREKDVDVLSERALGAFYRNRNPVLPPSVATVEEILNSQSFDLEKAVVAVVGSGDLVGKPIALWLVGKCKELIILNSTSDLKVLERVDLVISGVGKAGIIKADMLKESAGVIDFGYYYFPDGRLSGDLSTEGNIEKLLFYTPTPGGTGPILVTKLIENFYKLNVQ